MPEPAALQVVTCSPWHCTCPGTHLVHAGMEGAQVSPVALQSCVDCQDADAVSPTQACRALP